MSATSVRTSLGRGFEVQIPVGDDPSQPDYKQNQIKQTHVIAWRRLLRRCKTEKKATNRRDYLRGAQNQNDPHARKTIPKHHLGGPLCPKESRPWNDARRTFLCCGLLRRTNQPFRCCWRLLHVDSSTQATASILSSYGRGGSQSSSPEV